MSHLFKFAFLFLGALAFSAGAYGADPQGKTKIGASYMTLNNIFFDPMNAGASEAAKKEGADYVVVDARLDISRQIDGVENLIAQSVSAIVLNPVPAPSHSIIKHPGNDAEDKKTPIKSFWLLF